MKESRWVWLRMGSCPAGLVDRVFQMAGFDPDDWDLPGREFDRSDEERWCAHRKAQQAFGAQVSEFVPHGQTLWAMGGRSPGGMFGLTEYTEVFETLEAFGVPYDAISDADAEAMSVRRSWRPELLCGIEHALDSFGSVVLTQSDYAEIVRRATAAGGDVFADLHYGVEAHFASPPDLWDASAAAHETQRSRWYGTLEAFLLREITLFEVAERLGHPLATKTAGGV